MSIQTEITRIAQAKTDIKNVVNSKVANTITNQTIDAFPPLIDSSIAAYKNLIPWIEGSGSSFTIDNAEAGKLDKFEIEGNTHQETTIGKNVLNTFNLGTGTKNGVTCTFNNETQEITFNGNCTADNTGFDITNLSIPFTANTTKLVAYYVSGSITGEGKFTSFASGYQAYDYINIAQLNSSKNKMVIPSINTVTKIIFKFRFENGTSLSNFKIKIMITDNEDTTFEKFTYGASPNPDYPQPIEAVTGDNTINVHGKNLLNLNDLQETQIGNLTYSVNPIGYLVFNGTTQSTNISLKTGLNKPLNGEYTLIFKKISGTFTGTQTHRFSIGNSSNTGASQSTGRLLTNTFNSSSEIVVISGTINDTLDRVDFYTNSGTTFENYIIAFYLVKGTYTNNNIPEYQPYQSKDYEISLGNIELCKIGDYQDYIGKSTGKNLFDKDNANILNAYIDANSSKVISNNANRTFYLSCLPNTTYSISKKLGATFSVAYTKELPQDNIDVFGFNNTVVYLPDNYVSITTTTGENAKYLVCRFFQTAQDSLSLEDMLATIQVEQNSQATDYEPYGEQWYIKKNIGKVVLNGSENWQKTGTQYQGLFSASIVLTDMKRQNIFDGDIYSNYFKEKPFTIQEEAITKSSLPLSYDFMILRISDSKALTIEEFKTWLSTHNTTVYYVLATPTYEPITNSTLINQLEAIETETGTNIFEVSNENNVLPDLYVLTEKKDSYKN